ncbi:MAG: DUF2142 domain-containing protein [Lachnospiraceae bacterium]
MKEEIVELWKKYRKTLILLSIAMAVAGGIELCYNAQVLSWNSTHESKTNYGIEQLNVIGMAVKEDVLVAGSDACEIHLYPKGDYVDKLIYTYTKKDSNTMLDATITMVAYDAYGNGTVKELEDHNPFLLKDSVVNISSKVEELCITIPADSKGVEISNIYTKNEPHFNGMRWLFFTSLGAVLLIFWNQRNQLKGKVERIFLLIGLTVGTMLVLIMPLNKVGFDEETHFRNAYNIKLSKSVSSTEAIENLKIASLFNAPYNIPQSREERDVLEDYYQDTGDYTKNGEFMMRVPTKISTVGAFEYIFMALGIKLGKLLHLPFIAVYTMGRLFNMWSYLILIYFAIKRIPIGKYIMAVLALMPTAIFQAAVYSCDPIITGCVYLGIAYLVAELIEKDKKLSIKNGMIILGALGFGIVPKAVYVPVMALGFLIPTEKFINDKQKKIFRIANVICILGLLMTFVIPMLVTEGGIGDIRGGNVDVVGQISLILSHPLGYLNVWLTNVADTFWSYGFGEGALGTLGHLSVSTCVPAIGMLLIVTIMTDNIDRSELDLNIRQKWAMFAAAVLSVAFIWGALYLTFTEVGETYIGGVQGRYFIPVLFIFYLLLRRKNIKNNMNPIHYHYIIFGCTLFIMYKTIYDCVLQPYCF